SVVRSPTPTARHCRLRPWRTSGTEYALGSPFTTGSTAIPIEIPQTRETASRALTISASEPTHGFRVDFLRRSKADLDGHRLVDLRGLEPSARLLSIEPESKIDPVLRRRLHAGEGPPRRHE